MKRRKLERIMACAMAVFMSAVSVFGMTGCGAEEDTLAALSGEESVTLLEVDTVMPKVTDVCVDGEYMGVLEYENQVAVVPMLSGKVTATYYEVGDYVEAGALLFQIDDEAYQLSLQNARLAYEQARVGVDSQLGQIEMGRDSAANSVATAQEGISQIQDSYDYFNSQINEIIETREDLATQRADMKEDLNELRRQIEDTKKELENAVNAYSAAYQAYVTAQQQKIQDEAMGVPSTITDAMLDSLREAYQGAASAVSSVQSKLASLQSAEAQLEAGIKSLDSSMDSLDSSRENLEYQRDNLDYSLEQAQRGEELAQANLDYYDNYTIPTMQSNANMTLNQAAIGIESAELQLSYTQVTAPVSGNIVAINVEELGLAQAGYAAYTIVSDDTAIVSFNVPESTYRMLSLGQEITAERNGGVYRGAIVELPLLVDQRSGLFVIKAALHGNTDELIMGTTMKVNLTTQHVEDVVTIPIDCVYYEGGMAFTYVLEDTIVRKVAIETGLYDDENMQIISGISPDMQVITTWSSELRDGLEVRPGIVESDETDVESEEE